MIGASTGIFGAVWAQAQLRKALGIAGARVIDAELAVGGAHDAFLPSGALRDPGLATGLRDVVAALVAAQPEREPALVGHGRDPTRSRLHCFQALHARAIGDYAARAAGRARACSVVTPPRGAGCGSAPRRDTRPGGCSVRSPMAPCAVSSGRWR